MAATQTENYRVTFQTFASPEDEIVISEDEERRAFYEPIEPPCFMFRDTEPFSSVDGLIAIGLRNGKVFVSTNQHSTTIEASANNKKVISVALSPCKKLLACGTESNKVQVWVLDLENEDEEKRAECYFEHTFDGHLARFNALNLMFRVHDSAYLACGVRLYDWYNHVEIPPSEW